MQRVTTGFGGQGLLGGKRVQVLQTSFLGVCRRLRVKYKKIKTPLTQGAKSITTGLFLIGGSGFCLAVRWEKKEVGSTYVKEGEEKIPSPKITAGGN